MRMDNIIPISIKLGRKEDIQSMDIGQAIISISVNKSNKFNSIENLLSKFDTVELVVSNLLNRKNKRME